MVGEIEEVWKTLVQDEEIYSKYKVSNYGRVWNLRADKEVAQVVTGKPAYRYVNLYRDDGSRVLRRVNNIVSWTFHGKPPSPQHTSDHIDRDKFNNVEWNLRWANKREQSTNKDSAVLMPCGTPVISWVENKGYDTKHGVGRYIVGRLRNNTKEDLKDILFSWANHINPYPYKWVERSLETGIEYEEVWYPNTESFVRYKGNCTVETYRERLRKGMSVEEALIYIHDPKQSTITTHGFSYKGEVDTIKGHCETHNVSYLRIGSLMSKRGLSFEDAMNTPAERVIKHNINGITKRNSDWYKTFNIDSRTANVWLNSSGCKTKRTFRDVLEKYGVDTSEMEIYPCDGDVVMYHSPL